MQRLSALKRSIHEVCHCAACALIVAMLRLPSALHPQEVTTGRAWCEDEAAVLQREARCEAFVPFKGAHTQGFDKSPVWGAGCDTICIFSLKHGDGALMKL